jgi:hypothetical protein
MKHDMSVVAASDRDVDIGLARVKEVATWWHPARLPNSPSFWQPLR